MSDRTAQSVNEVEQNAVCHDGEVYATLVYAEARLLLGRSEDLWSVEQAQARLLYRWKNSVGCSRGQVDKEVHSYDHR
jgi:hypothetical protein